MRSPTTLLFLLQAFALIAPTLAQSPDRLGGAASIRDTSPNAFGYPSPMLDRSERRLFQVGNSFFKQNWIESPATASERDGLGPLFNARSCSACHLRDGRSAPPAATDVDRHGLLMRIGVTQVDAPDAPHAHYGGQIQDSAVQECSPEAQVDIRYESVVGRFVDGTPFELLRPHYSLRSLGYGELGDDVALGPRTAPHLIGLGLLESVPNETLRRLADPDDGNGDGVSGRVHRLDDDTIGRFGWKATQPTVRTQVAAAFVNDMGITSVVFPDEVLTKSQRMRVAIEPTAPEIREATFDKVVFYTRTLAVPAQREAEVPLIIQGGELFDRFGCAACHLRELTTGADAFHPGYANQTFHPYTDLLLHDMGVDLADGKRDGDARPTEWRTPPLWGIGLIGTVSGHTRLLHDGRARNLSEAILWHGGEGQQARESYRAADREEREALLAFLRSL